MCYISFVIHTKHLGRGCLLNKDLGDFGNRFVILSVKSVITCFQTIELAYFGQVNGKACLHYLQNVK